MNYRWNENTLRVSCALGTTTKIRLIGRKVPGRQIQNRNENQR